MKLLIGSLWLSLGVTGMLAQNGQKVPPEAKRQEGVPQGRLEKYHFSGSKIFPGTERDYWVYVPAQYPAEGRPPCLMVFQDGGGYCNDRSGSRAHIVFDNLIHSGEMPVTVGLFINPGLVPAPTQDAEARYNRSFEYDGMGDSYARFLIEEMIPLLESRHGIKVSADPNDRGICGASSGAICAFTAAWERPDAFRRVYSMIGTFVGLRGGDGYPSLIRKTEPKPLRIFMEDGSNDLNIYGGDWWMANQTMQRALEWAGYEVAHQWGDKGHSHEHGAAIFPEAMRWLWKDYPKPVTTHPEKSQSRATEYLVAGEGWEEVIGGGTGWYEGLAVTEDGTLWFTDVPNSRLYKLGADGRPQLVDDDTGRTNGIALGPDGRLYGAASGAKQIRAWDLNTGKSEVVGEGTTSNDIVVRHDGTIYYSDPPSSTIWLLRPGSRTPVAVDSFRNPNGIGLSADQSLLFVGDFAGRFIYSYQIAEDGTLRYKQPYFHMHLPLGTDTDGGFDGMCTTRDSLLVASSKIGIQICDQPGRVQLILPPPPGSVRRTCYATFGGADWKTLYVATPEAIYKRRTQLVGANHWQAPVKPPKPKL